MESESYYRARRAVAFTGGALLAFLALTAFVYQLPSTFFPHIDGPPWLHWMAFAVAYMVYATINLPFDVWAGYWLPCRHHRSCKLLPVYLGTLFRAETAQFLVMTLSALALLEAGRRWGHAGAVGAFAAAQGLLLLMRPALARYLGIAARPLPARLWLPAVAWNTASLALVLQLPWCGAATVHHLLETLLGWAVLSVPGYWLLRSWNRGSAGAMLFLSWAGFGLFSRVTADRMGLPENWLASSEDSSAYDSRNGTAASRIVSS
jgi:hypothetical protein